MAKAKKEVKEQPVEQVLWAAADKLRKNMDAAEYKHIVLGLIFLKYISDNFYELYHKLEAGEGDYAGADPNDPYEYRAENVFYVPPQARWDYLQSRAKLPTIGKDIDDVMDAIEKDNPSLKGVLPKEYAKEKLDKQSLGGLIDLVSTIALGDSVSRSNDVLGRVYEYFLGQFALAEGKKGGQFYTPRCVVQLLVEMLEPYERRVFDPCCGSGGMFVQSEKFIEAHADRYNGKAKEIDKLFESVVSVYGQESNQTTWRLCKMNLAFRGIFKGGAKFKNGDTLVARITPCLENGKTAYVYFLVDKEVAFGSTEFIVLRAKAGISDSKFIFYLAISDDFRDTAIQLMSGSSGRQRVETEALKQKVFSLPPLPEQKAIAEVLSSLDDKIDLLTRQNKTLEDLGQAYFRRWFLENDNDTIMVSEIAKLENNSVSPKRQPLEPFHHYSIPAYDNAQTPVVELGNTILSNKFTVQPNSILVFNSPESEK
jgi:hypothetical protein